jgi:hypothetical protein
MPLADLNLVVLFTYECSLIQPRLLADDFFAQFRWSCLIYLVGRSTPNLLLA